jgi:hypothetical protein
MQLQIGIARPYKIYSGMFVLDGREPFSILEIREAVEDWLYPAILDPSIRALSPIYHGASLVLV